MRRILMLGILSFLLNITCFGQLTTASNGLTAAGSNVKLGGTLSEATSLDLGASFSLNVKKSTSQYFSILNNGNVGIGTNNPLAKFVVSGNTTNLPTALIGNISLQSYDNTNASISNNVYFNGSAYSFIQNGFAGSYQIVAGEHLLYTSSASGTGGGTATMNLLFKLRTNGNLLLGTSTDNSLAKLQVSGKIYATGFILNNNGGIGKILASDASGEGQWVTATQTIWTMGGSQSVSAEKSFGTTDNYAIPIITNNIERMRIGANGNVGIGTNKIADAGYKLYVETGIRTRKVKVDQNVWADYVFQPGYPLYSLGELENFIRKNGHLPSIPTTEEVNKEGIDLGEMNKKLLEKIEELTLYTIDLNKRINQLEMENEELKKIKEEIKTLKQFMLK